MLAGSDDRYIFRMHADSMLKVWRSFRNPPRSASPVTRLRAIM